MTDRHMGISPQRVAGVRRNPANAEFALYSLSLWIA